MEGLGDDSNMDENEEIEQSSAKPSIGKGGKLAGRGKQSIPVRIPGKGKPKAAPQFDEDESMEGLGDDSNMDENEEIEQSSAKPSFGKGGKLAGRGKQPLSAGIVGKGKPKAA